MQASIQQVIHGLRYDTERAEVVASNEYWDGSNFERHGRNTHLYKTANGRFFLGHSTQWQGERNHIEPLSESAAKQWYEDLPEHAMTYAEAFGVEPEDA